MLLVLRVRLLELRRRRRRRLRGDRSGGRKRRLRLRLLLLHVEPLLQRLGKLMLALLLKERIMICSSFKLEISWRPKIRLIV